MACVLATLHNDRNRGSLTSTGSFTAFLRICQNQGLFKDFKGPYKGSYITKQLGSSVTLSGRDVTVMMTSSILCLTGLQPLQLWRYCDATEAEADKPSRGEGEGKRGRGGEGREGEGREGEGKREIGRAHV